MKEVSLQPFPRKQIFCWKLLIISRHWICPVIREILCAVVWYSECPGFESWSGFIYFQFVTFGTQWRTMIIFSFSVITNYSLYPLEISMDNVQYNQIIFESWSGCIFYSPYDEIMYSFSYNWNPNPNSRFYVDSVTTFLHIFNPYHAKFLKWNNPSTFLALSLLFLGITRWKLELGQPTV